MVFRMIFDYQNGSMVITVIFDEAFSLITPDFGMVEALLEPELCAKKLGLMSTFWGLKP